MSHEMSKPITEVAEVRKSGRTIHKPEVFEPASVPKRVTKAKAVPKRQPEPEEEDEEDDDGETEELALPTPPVLEKATKKDVPVNMDDLVAWLKQMPSDEYKKMNGIYLKTCLESRVLGAVTATPRTAKAILKAIQSEFPGDFATTNTSDINRILYKNSKVLKMKETISEKSEGRGAPLWSK